ncbi:MAG: hypothetical protein NTW86_30625 [Candidatus Sumerlaeota bacterium]|nr:hypothetical protein [Candidatus Sumerlaeota bacterium]
MEISNLSKIMSDTTEWNIIPGKDVKGKVFAYLKDIDAETALQKIVEANGYRLTREGNTIVIMTQEEYDLRVGAEMEQRVFPLQYARAAQAAPLLAAALSPKGRAMADAASNQIVVSDMPNRFEGIEALLRQIDQKQETRVVSLQHAVAADLWAALKPFVGDPAQFEEVSSLKGLSPNNVPIVDRSEAQSSVVVQDGHTLAGGGLIEEERRETIKRAPILGEVPLIKHLFRSTSHEMVQSELLLFITPKIVDTGSSEPPPEQLRAHRMQLTWTSEPPTTRIDKGGE